MVARQFSPHRLRKARQEAGISRKQLSEAIERHYGRLEKYELGLQSPSLSAFIALGDVLGVPLDDLLEPVTR